MPAIDGLPAAGRREPHVGHGPEARRAVWPDRDTVRESYGSRPPMNVLEPDALDGLRAVGVPRPPRRSGRARVRAGGRGVVLRVRHAARRARRRRSTTSPSLHADDDDRVRRRHRPARRHLRRAGRARRRRPHRPSTAPTSSCRRTPRAPPRSCANTWPDVLAPLPRHVTRCGAETSPTGRGGPTRSRACPRWCGRPRRRTRTRRGRL